MLCKFAGDYYESRSDMLVGIAWLWCTDSGGASPDMVRERLGAQTDEEIARECVAEWRLDQVRDADEDPDAEVRCNVREFARAVAVLRADVASGDAFSAK